MLGFKDSWVLCVSMLSGFYPTCVKYPNGHFFQFHTGWFNLLNFIVAVILHSYMLITYLCSPIWYKYTDRSLYCWTLGRILPFMEQKTGCIDGEFLKSHFASRWPFEHLFWVESSAEAFDIVVRCYNLVFSNKDNLQSTVFLFNSICNIMQVTFSYSVFTVSNDLSWASSLFLANC